MEYRRNWDWVYYCIPAGTISGVRVGIHWTFPLAFVLHAWNAYRDAGPTWAWVIATTVFLLYWIILAHEFGHVFAARREGIGAERVMLWPLGGLAHLGEEATGHSEVRIAAAGPAVNLGFAVLLLPVLALVGIRISAGLWHPLDHWWPILTSDGTPHFGQHVLHCLYKTNLIVLLFNLVPAFPLDGGRILRGFLHPRLGPVRSVIVASSVAIGLCLVLLFWAVMTKSLLLAFIAVFVFWTAWQTRRQATMVAHEEPVGSDFLGHDFSQGITSLERESREDRRAARREEKRRLKREREEEERRLVDQQVDALLDKISREGMESLTRRERAFLEKASRMKR